MRSSLRGWASGRSLAAACACLGLLCLAGPAAARSIYLNGVKIDGLTNQEFKGATVRIDATGNIHIEAKGYSVKKLGGGDPAATAAGPPVEESYWLVSTETNPKKVQWDVEVYIANKLVDTIRWDGGQVVKEVTPYLIAGNNQVHFRARRNLSQPRISFSPADKLTVIIGEGSKQGSSVVVTKPLVTFVRSAADDEPVDKDFTFKAR